MKEQDLIYRIIFSQNGKTYELYSRYVSEETMVGFIEVEELIFTKDKALIDPAEEKLKSEFENVERIYIPMHAIYRIDEVMKPGPSRIKEQIAKGESNVWHFPAKKPQEESSNE